MQPSLRRYALCVAPCDKQRSRTTHAEGDVLRRPTLADEALHNHGDGARVDTVALDHSRCGVKHLVALGVHRVAEALSQHIGDVDGDNSGIAAFGPDDQRAAHLAHLLLQPLTRRLGDRVVDLVTVGDEFTRPAEAAEHVAEGLRLARLAPRGHGRVFGGGDGVAGHRLVVEGPRIEQHGQRVGAGEVDEVCQPADGACSKLAAPRAPKSCRRDGSTTTAASGSALFFSAARMVCLTPC